MSQDVSNAIAYVTALRNLQITLNTSQHVNHVLSGAFGILNQSFSLETAAKAVSQPDRFHHVYEWDEIGSPPFALFKLKMAGRGRNRAITWEWQPSKTSVPIRAENFPANFNVGKLNKNHRFIWKAPIMEYGLPVTIRPRHSDRLVFPNPTGEVREDTDRRAPRDVVFTPYTYTINSQGGSATGQFTLWFESWFEIRAPALLRTHFESQRNTIFRQSVIRRTAPLARIKRMSIGISSAGAREGKIISKLITGDLERYYRKMGMLRGGL